MANDKTFEAALKELETVVEKLEQGELPLEEAINCFEQGVKAAGNCQKLLNEAELKVEQLRLDADGALKSEPFAEAEGE